MPNSASTAAKAAPRRFLRLPKVQDRTGLGRTTIYRGVKAGWFPAPYDLFADPTRPDRPARTVVAWLESEIDEWIQRRIDARSAPGRSTPEHACSSEIAA